jgi:multicomponent Na+:H+ antiporter subunit B
MTNYFLLGTTRLLVPIQMSISIILLLRGHNEPGGGFIAGLMSAAALTFYFLANDKIHVWVGKIGARKLIKIGLIMAVIAGLWGFFVHGVFLQAVWLFGISLPIVGDIKLGSVLLFDLGVFVLVIGFVMQMLESLSQETL